MNSTLDDSVFVDADYNAAKSGGYATPGTTAQQRPPTREEIESKVSETQQRLAELKAAQEKLERERASLEEARRRQVEFQTGREEMVAHLTRGTGLLEEAEFSARRDAEQMAKTIADLRDAQQKLSAINQESWTKENWNVELTRALTTIENARMEWNSARLKWPLLSGEGAAPAKAAAPAPAATPAFLDSASFAQLCRVGFALTWPVLLGAAGIIVALFLR
jgi:hypothetical protein